MPFTYKKILIVGATSGIGRALAERFVNEGSKVIVSGRRVERLEEFVQKHGSDKASAHPFDIIKLDLIPQFVSNVTSANPDLDCVLLNSGMQTIYDFTKPESVDITRFQMELTTNYTSMMALTVAFLPFFIEQQHPNCFMYTSSSLGLIPLFRVPGYSATKAAMHSMLLSLRVQFKDSKTKFVEILPPAVQTELHDHMGPHGRNIGMPLDEFTNDAYEQLAKGEEEVIVNNHIPQLEATLKNMREGFESFTERMRSVIP